MQTSALAFLEAGLSTLERALHDRTSDLRNLQLATLSPDGRPGLRTLVLRGLTRFPCCAEMHSDARAAKVRDIAHAGAVACLAWSAADQLQLRFDGIARLHRGDDTARARWDTLSANARNAYGLRSEPGGAITDPANRTHLPPEEQFRQFAVILVSLAGIDMLRLGDDGSQTRASGRFTASGLAAEWVGP